MAIGKRVVILGGSVAGLCAAGAVAPHFDEVIVLERDSLPADAQHRRGVPQSKHPHFMLNSGRRAIESLFPGYEAALLAAGGRMLNPSRDAAYCEAVGWAPRKSGSMTMVYGSRILIERVLRDMVRKLDNVTIREEVVVRGIETERGGTGSGRVTGVNFTDANGEQSISADLVVDALGRGSSVPAWLAAAGWAEPPVRSLDAKVAYSSLWYQLPPADERPDSWWWQHLAIMPNQAKGEHPEEFDYLVNFFPIEGDRAIACMGAWGLELPKKTDSFIAAAQRIRTPVFAAAMKECEQLSEVHLTRSTGNKWRRYDLMPTPPLGLVAIGDAICAFNPFYGQGMSSAARSAIILAERLRNTTELDTWFFRAFLGDQRKSLQVPWMLAVARDQGYDHATGTETASRLVRKVSAAMVWPVFNLITAAAREDDVVEEHFARVFNLDESMIDMAKNPRVIAGLIRYKVKLLLGRQKLPRSFDLQRDPPATDYTLGVA
ncbi:FAD-dependent oxidoreductase [Antrihabitans spumae]|uniref:FAD-dependent oxidoreductase n=1 Tax=Antrihabitans spumae TaxID=3373370 RepID=A0ABW7KBD4_9NOCA